MVWGTVDEDREPLDIGGWLTAVAGVALVATLIRPGNQTANVLNAMNGSFAGMVKAATGTGIPALPGKTPAERFSEEAMASIGDFWKGFSDDLQEML